MEISDQNLPQTHGHSSGPGMYGFGPKSSNQTSQAAHQTDINPPWAPRNPPVADSQSTAEQVYHLSFWISPMDIVGI